MLELESIIFLLESENNEAVKCFVNEYSESWKQETDSGWGCGYVAVSKTSAFGRLIDLKDLLNEGLHFAAFGEEITYNNEEGEFYVLGFDTAHAWNKPEVHDKNYVERATKDMYHVVNEFSEEDLLDAKAEALKDFKKSLSKI